MSNVELRITEEWIREKLHLTIDSLNDVRSLALPGSYHEKITHLGRSLVGFTRLKQLDLSRNALQSLEGLEHLKLLEFLNLYYNNISTLKELFRLRFNTNLKELDLRLNPVTKDEPDYRLFVIHMLVNLRKLDDRQVKETERKAAIMHFNSDQAHDMMQGVVKTEDVEVKTVEESDHAELISVPSHVKSRKDLVKSLGPTQLPMDEACPAVSVVTPTKYGVDHRSQRTSEDLPYQPKVHFTPHPKASSSPVARRQASGPSYQTSPHVPSPDANNILPSAEELVEVVKRHKYLTEMEHTELLKSFVQWLKSHQENIVRNEYLRYDMHTLDELKKVVNVRESELAMKEDLLANQEKEIFALRTQMEDQIAQLERSEYERSSEQARRRQLEEAEKDLIAVQKHVQKLQSEKNILQAKLNEKSSSNDMKRLQSTISQLQKENDLLKNDLMAASHYKEENTTLDYVKQLVSMLQTSHTSIVNTNSQLLKELEEVKANHAKAIQQMHMNYEHLRKTVEVIHDS